MPPKGRHGTTTATTRSRRRKNVQPQAKRTIPAEQYIQKKYRSLYDQVVVGSFHANGLKTCNKLLRLRSADSVALRTKVQLLIALDRFKEALAALPNGEASGSGADWALERAYCLYKLGREREAVTVIGDPSGRQVRGKQVLLAQAKYKLEDFEESRGLYEELLATSETNTPEYDDLRRNLRSCESFLLFHSEVPAILSNLSLNPRFPATEELESAPLGPLIASHLTLGPASKSKTTSAAPIKPQRPRKHRRSKRQLAPREGGAEGAAKLDAERWLPKRERAVWQDLQSRREKDRGKARKKAQKEAKGKGKTFDPTATQGSAAPAGDTGTAGTKSGKGRKGR